MAVPACLGCQDIHPTALLTLLTVRALAQAQTYADEDDNEIQLGSAGGEDGAAVVKAKLALKAAQKTTKDRNRIKGSSSARVNKLKYKP
eukprot:1155672-Pelagomonas_calceolata.AAC.8